jgi:hypothetical protein
VTDPMAEAISLYFGGSEPGAAIHHLVLLAGKPNAVGLHDLAAAELSVHAIAPVADPGTPAAVAAQSTEIFVARSVVDAIEQARARGRVLGAALTYERNRVSVAGGDKAARERARRMHAQGRLAEMAEAVEVTDLYAAAFDGRRWHGTHEVTGPRAGHIDGPHLLEGPPRPADMAEPVWRLLRAGVGLRW